MADDLSGNSLATESAGAGTSGTEAAPSGGASPDTGQAAGAPDAASKIIEITDPDRYRYNGRSPKDWDSGYMRQQDYTAKTQAIAQERKFYDNLSIDLQRVRDNPQLVDQFRQVYPEKFHAYLGVIGQAPARRPQTQPGVEPTREQYAQLDPQTRAELQRVIEANRTREVQAISAQLDATFSKMATKYPFADEEAVVARGQALYQKMKEADPTNPNLTISEKQWEALWKSQHERAHGLSKAQYDKQVKAQIEASRKGGDAGPGGGIPGQAPRQHKTIKEATAQALADIELGAI